MALMFPKIILVEWEVRRQYICKKYMVEVKREIRFLYENNPFDVFLKEELKELKVLEEKKLSIVAIEEAT